MTRDLVPPSGEVIAEEIQENLAKVGLPRDEQGDMVRDFVRSVADEIAKLVQASIGSYEP